MPRRRPKVLSGGGSSPGAFGPASGYGHGISRCGEGRAPGARILPIRPSDLGKQASCTLLAILGTPHDLRNA